MSYDKVDVSEEGETIEFDGEKLSVPETPAIPIIYGDGIGVDVAPAAQTVLESAANATGFADAIVENIEELS
ncbi:isocitrate dehydrogenase [Halalkalicoccus paucihalophilus]|uniref:isocitrate dehydrogenase (NADP(+)) n=1 Tax=Halalkalicoccus paucihalophilus TaxID=1008153 RepID=A0A151AAP3_9EURY|nr:isocitrate dehydrogenase [Halalkalicoccus paucihalophilus]